MVESVLAPGRVRQDLRVYAVGDIHGCLDRVAAVHDAVQRDMAANPAAETLLLHLGDYVDRGPDSAGVIGLLAGRVAPPVTRRVDLGGNHEAMMLAALSGDEEAEAMWLENGGKTTLRSYGDMQADDADWRTAIPSAHRHWLATRLISHREGDYLFVHAGIRPGRPIARQSPQDLLWIREPFLSSTVRHPCVIVHGHTPTAAPEFRANRIGIDTGAVLGGALTCLVLQDNRMRLLSV